MYKIFFSVVFDTDFFFLLRDLFPSILHLTRQTVIVVRQWGSPPDGQQNRGTFMGTHSLVS